ncbi:MmcB family DNA repair protein [Paracoccus aerodenitrificans]|uniref:MmcB family DNA repair protein n=1 Tax=Paracoccus aerodenitrificans TaxID=3017781 RepID=UPI0022F11E15|nr:MmcB family DNA repair protein [Paracoccus aerodenitrificans]WBU65486.1 MmcB family DNA repair protein [Paracoccus aerodenitrificans]
MAQQHPDPHLPGQPGFRLARGVSRMLRSLDHAVLYEFVPMRGLRVDVISIAPGGEIWITECKSCRADFLGDRKWQSYLEWSDRFFWAVDCDFPGDLLPEETGLIRADAFGAEILRNAPLTKMATARRTRLTRDIARIASLRLQALTDPEAAAI